MEKKQEKRIIVFLIILIFLFSFTVGFSIYSKGEKKYTYENNEGDTFSFVKSSQGDHWLNWTTKSLISGNLYRLHDWVTPFAYGPLELEEIPIEDPYIGVRLKKSDEVYLTRN
jgi:hypothetical protein